MVPEINYLMQLDPAHQHWTEFGFGWLPLSDCYEEWLQCIGYEEVKGG